MELDTKHYMWKLEERMKEIMEDHVTCRNAEMLSILIHTWHDIESMEGHDSKEKKKKNFSLPISFSKGGFFTSQKETL